MTSGNSKSGHSIAPKQGVPARYTFSKLKDDVQCLHRIKSLRAIAQDLNERAGPGKRMITHRTIQRVLSGKEPINPAIRDALGLPCLAPAPVCPKCGVVHVTKKCTAGRKPATKRHNWKRDYQWAASMLFYMVRTQ